MKEKDEISMEDLREHIKTKGAAIASNIIFLFDDYGNVQLLKKSDDVGGFFYSCMFTHVDKVNHNNSSAILTFSLGKFLTGTYQDEQRLSLGVYNEWDTISQIPWIRENHHN